MARKQRECSNVQSEGEQSGCLYGSPGAAVQCGTIPKAEPSAAVGHRASLSNSLPGGDRVHVDAMPLTQLCTPTSRTPFNTHAQSPPTHPPTQARTPAVGWMGVRLGARLCVLVCAFVRARAPGVPGTRVQSRPGPTAGKWSGATPPNASPGSCGAPC